MPGASTFHLGEDTIGAGNYAPVTGTVVYASYYGSWGNIVGIRETANPAVIWWVAHHASLAVGLGRLVTEGQTYTGPMGRTGNVSGIHAHTERRVGGRAIPGTGTATNPRQYYTSTAGGGAQPLEINHRSMEDNEMYVQGLDAAGVYVTWTDANGILRMRSASPNEAQFAALAGLIVKASNDSITALGKEAAFDSRIDSPLGKIGSVPFVRILGGTPTGGTTTISDADKKQIIDGAGAAARKAIVAGG